MQWGLAHLVEDTTVIRRHIARVQKQAFLH